MSFLLLILIIIFSIVLIKSADITVISLKKLVSETGMIGLSAVVIAVGTSFPELFVGITSAIEGQFRLALGVALGSNIANIALVGAGAGLITGRVHISETVLKRVVWVTIFCGMLPYFLLLDGNLNRIDGVIMLFAYCSYILGFFKNYYVKAAEEEEGGTVLTKLFTKINHVSNDKLKDLARMFIGISLMLFSADTIVKFSHLMAERINIPIFVIGLFILAVGTSLPEFAFSLRSLKDHEPQMFLGNLTGSIVANTTLVIGLSALINPIYSISFQKYIVPAVVFAFVYFLFFFFIRSKKRLERWESAILIGIYFLFFLIELY